MFRDLVAQLGGAMPNYVWKAIENEKDFKKLWEPFPWNNSSIAEIRRREGVEGLRTVLPRPSLGKRQAEQEVEWEADDMIYMIHCFKPRSSSLVRLLRTLLLSQEPVVWQVALSPQRLEEAEEQGLIINSF